MTLSRARYFNGKRYDWDSLQRFDKEKADREARKRRAMGLLVRVCQMGRGWALYTHTPDGWDLPDQEEMARIEEAVA